MVNTLNNILEVNDLKVSFNKPTGFNILNSFNKKNKNPSVLTAVDNVSFTLKAGEILGLVGESGCGKSTLGRAILQLIKPDSGSIIYNGQDLTKLNKKLLREKRKEIQIIFQDPLASLNPRMTVGQIIAEPLKNFYPNFSKKQLIEKVFAVMQEVGLLAEHINRYPHEFSGGQCQRIGIARALILNPKVIICDEPVSALDVSIQAQIINLLKSLQKKHGLSLIFIAHNLNVVRNISDRIMVMYLGKIVELTDAQNLIANPKHPYTQALLSAIPIPDPMQERGKKTVVLTGELPSPMALPSGCRFRTRCKFANPDCMNYEPRLKTINDVNDNRHLVACHLC